ncbi:winged helix-turn-helix domain-containing protein [Vibrio panuliri]|nr:helix-turn-helix domain-containing protein [Vibrio panuliri]
MNSSYFHLGDFYWRKESQTLFHKTNTDSTFQGVSSLTKKQYDLLCCLIDAHPAVVDKETIVENVWETKHISSESLPQLINRTRQVLGDHDKNILVNEPGKGYRLNFTTLETENINDESKEMSIDEHEEKLVSKIDAPLVNKPWIMLITLSLVVVVIFQCCSLYSVLYHKLIFNSIVTSTPYPYITEKNDQTIVTIDNHECIYYQDQQLLSCP